MSNQAHPSNNSSYAISKLYKRRRDNYSEKTPLLRLPRNNQTAVTSRNVNRKAINSSELRAVDTYLHQPYVTNYDDDAY